MSFADITTPSVRHWKPKPATHLALHPARVPSPPHVDLMSYRPIFLSLSLSLSFFLSPPLLPPPLFFERVCSQHRASVQGDFAVQVSNIHLGLVHRLSTSLLVSLTVVTTLSNGRRRKRFPPSPPQSQAHLPTWRCVMHVSLCIYIMNMLFLQGCL